jgi:hypothetical protein
MCATMNVGGLGTRPMNRAGLSAANVVLGRRRNHSSPRMGKPSTWRRVPVVRTEGVTVGKNKEIKEVS